MTRVFSREGSSQLPSYLSVRLQECVTRGAHQNLPPPELSFPYAMCLLWYTTSSTVRAKPPIKDQWDRGRGFQMQKESTVEVQKYRLNVGSSLLLLQPLWLAQPGVGSPTAMGPAATNMLATASAPGMQFLAFLTSPPAPLGDRVLASMSNVLNIPHVTMHHE